MHTCKHTHPHRSLWRSRFLLHTETVKVTSRDTQRHLHTRREMHQGREASMINMVYLKGESWVGREQRQIWDKYF